MSAIPRQSSSVCYVLREDPELADGLEPDLRAQATEALVAREIQIPAGAWRPQPPSGIQEGLGMLVVKGVLIRRSGVDKRFGAELLGVGDVLRPPYGPDESALSITVNWFVLEPLRLAVLDERFVRQLAHFPQLAGRLFSRAVDRSRQLGVNMAIVHQARVDVRLHMLFWHLAGRWGKVRSDGVLIPLRLTHVVLADLVAARRPTVTSALSDLGRRGVVRPVPEGWLLSGDPPASASPDPT